MYMNESKGQHAMKPLPKDLIFNSKNSAYNVNESKQDDNEFSEGVKSSNPTANPSHFNDKRSKILSGKTQYRPSIDVDEMKVDPSPKAQSKVSADANSHAVILETHNDISKTMGRNTSLGQSNMNQSPIVDARNN